MHCWAVCPQRYAAKPIPFDRFLARTNAEEPPLAAGARVARLAHGEESGAARPVPAAPRPEAAGDRDAPRLADVPPTPTPPTPPEAQHEFRVQHFSPIGSIIDVLA